MRKGKNIMCDLKFSFQMKFTVPFRRQPIHESDGKKAIPLGLATIL